MTKVSFSTTSTCYGLDQSFNFRAHRTALCYVPVASEAKQAVKDTSGPSTRIKPTIGFVSLVSGPSLLIKYHNLLGLPDAAKPKHLVFPNKVSQ